MVTILSNINALAASRQLSVNKMGLQTAITRLTTGRRVNTAMDDAAGLSAGNTAQALARKLAAQVTADQVQYFQGVSDDAGNQQATQDAYRMAELEGQGNLGTEYAQLQTNNGGAASSGTLLTAIDTSSQAAALKMSGGLSAAQLDGAKAEAQQGIADAYLGADMGAEMANLTKYQILMQAGTSALNNANQSAQTVLSLFR
jgi:flagellin